LFLRSLYDFLFKNISHHGSFLLQSCKGRVQKKKCGKSMVFYQTGGGGGGGSPRVIKNQTPFLEKYFFSELVESF